MKLLPWIAAAVLAASAAPAAAQQRLDRPGPVPHSAAATEFPERVGEFRRVSVIQFDAEARDVSASYELQRGEDRMLLTVYVYPAARLLSAPGAGAASEVARATLCRQELANIGRAIENQQEYRGARRIEEGAAPRVAGVDAALSLRSVHRFTRAVGGAEREMRSETDLYCFVGGDWLVKYRATSNSGFDAAGAIRSFIRNGPWPGRIPPPALEETI